MPEPTPPVAAERPAEPLVYRPVSGLAIAGLACAALYAGLLLLSVVLAFLKQEPFYLASWLLVLALAGGLLSALALWQIRGSEGTRAGAGLARCGLWLAVFAGLGSFTFNYFTGLAIQQQANRFLMEKGPDAGFFPLLQQGEINQAFLLTIHPNKRQANPHDEKAMEKLYDLPMDPKESGGGMLSHFRALDFVRLLQQPYEPKAQVQERGVRAWEYAGKSYKVTRTYQISTPEGEFNLPITVQSFDSEVPGEGRKWMVVRQGDMKLQMVRLTELGQKMADLRASAALFASMCLAKLHGGRPFDLYLDTRPPGERLKRKAVHVAQLFGLGAFAGRPAPGAPAPWIPFTFAPDLPQALAGKGLFVFDGLQVRGTPDLAERIRRTAPYLLASGTAYLGNLPTIEKDEALLARWQKKDGRLEIRLRAGLALNLPDGQFPQGVTVTAQLVVSADAAADARDQSDPTRLWQLERIEFKRALPRMGPPMPPQPGGPG